MAKIFRRLDPPTGITIADLYRSARGNGAPVLLDVEVFDADPAPGGPISAWALGLVAVRATGLEADGRGIGSGRGPSVASLALEADGRGTGAGVPRATSLALEADGRGTGEGRGPSVASLALEADARGTGEGRGPSVASTGLEADARGTGEGRGPSVASTGLEADGSGTGEGRGPSVASTGLAQEVSTAVGVWALATVRAGADGLAREVSVPVDVWALAEAPRARADALAGGLTAGAALTVLEVEGDGIALGWVLGPDAAREVTGTARAAVLSRAGDVVGDVVGVGVGVGLAEGVGAVVEIVG